MKIMFTINHSHLRLLRLLPLNHLLPPLHLLLIHLTMKMMNRVHKTDSQKKKAEDKKLLKNLLSLNQRS